MDEWPDHALTDIGEFRTFCDRFCWQALVQPRPTVEARMLEHSARDARRLPIGAQLFSRPRPTPRLIVAPGCRR